MKFQVKAAEFVASASSMADFPAWNRPEMAIIGRSNVGKSTFINRVTGRKKLARTSDMPGRTQALVAFTVRGEKAGEKKGAKSVELTLVDLPGFGFAKLSHSERERLHRLVNEYIRERPQLKVVVLLNDCRRMPEEEELIVRDLAAQYGRHVLIVASKVDKLSRNEKEKNLRAIAEAYGLQRQDILESGMESDQSGFWERALMVLS